MDEVIEIDLDIKESATIMCLFHFPLTIDNTTGEEIKRIIEFVAKQMQKVRNKQKEDCNNILTTIYNFWEDSQEQDLERIFTDLDVKRN